MTDLDALEKRIATSVDYQHIHTPIVLALIAELRASRRVVEAARMFIDAVDRVNERPRREGVEMRAVRWQGELRAALAELEALK